MRSIVADIEEELKEEKTAATENEDVISGNKTFRPESFDDYIGQKDIINNLRVFVQSAKKRNDVLDHILLFGSQGLGKTSLSLVIAKEMGVKVKITSGPAIEKPGDLAAVLSQMNEGDILFIDEIHRLPKPVEEVLYSAMEDYAIDIVIGKDQGARSIRLDLPKFTLIGATTRAGMLSAPLRDRFGIVFRLSYYQLDELKKIALRSAEKLGIMMSDEAANKCADRSRGTPRICNMLVRRASDFATFEGSLVVDEELADKTFNALGIIEGGLDEMDRLIIDTIESKFLGGPVGLSTLAACLGEDEGTIENVYEPYLIYKGIIVKTPKGRMINRKGEET